jgi:protein phosphatase-4 regulatory subunit 3
MCDFIHNQNIKSLIEYIVTKHLFAASLNSVTDQPSLEDVATPYVQTLTILCRMYEDDLRQANEQVADQEGCAQSNGIFFDNSAAQMTGRSEKALEDQVRFFEWIRRLAHLQINDVC